MIFSGTMWRILQAQEAQMTSANDASNSSSGDESAERARKLESGE
jgi:hypothetical protein